MAVNAWDEPRAMVKNFVEENGLPYTVLLFGEKVHKEQYRGKAVPATYVLDRSGKIVHYHEGWGPGDEQKLAEVIEQALKQPAGA